MNQQFSVFALEPEDVARYIALRLRALEGDTAAFAASADELRAASRATVERQLARDDGSTVFSVAEGETLIGMIGFRRETKPSIAHKGSFWGWYVAPEWRGQGLGKLLLRTALMHARAQPGLEGIRVNFDAHHEAVKHLFVSAGFEEFGLETRALKVAGNYVDRLLMILDLQKDSKAV